MRTKTKDGQIAGNNTFAVVLVQVTLDIASDNLGRYFYRHPLPAFTYFKVHAVGVAIGPRHFSSPRSARETPQCQNRPTQYPKLEVLAHHLCRSLSFDPASISFFVSSTRP